MVACGAGKVSQMIDVNCKCHLYVDDALVETSQRGDVSVKVTFSVLAADDQAQVGKRITEYFQVDGKAVDKFYNLAEAVGLLSPEQRAAAAKAGQGLEIDETLMKGRTCCGEVHMEPNMRKNPATGVSEVDPEKPGPFPRIGFRTFAVGSKKAEGIPLDVRFAGKPQQSRTAPETQQQAPQKPQKPAGGAAVPRW